MLDPTELEGRLGGVTEDALGQCDVLDPRRVVLIDSVDKIRRALIQPLHGQSRQD
jgi:hypothetical protein